MKRDDKKRRPWHVTVLIGLWLVMGAWNGRSDEAESKASAGEIVMDRVPLREAIRSLTRQMGLNHILDPGVPGADCNPNPELEAPRISKRWRNASAEQALRSILKDHQLILVTNPVTTVVRIAPGSVAVRPVSASLVGPPDTNGFAPLIVIDDVPLVDALRNVTRQCGLKVDFDPAVLAAFEYDSGISIRWEDLTVRQALYALLDNYNLSMTEHPATGNAWIRFRKRR